MLNLLDSRYLTEQQVGVRGESFTNTGFTVRLATNTCWDIFQKRDHVLIGLSPGNGYFSPEERIHRMAQWGTSQFRSMHFFTWETPFVWSLQAIGYPARKAKAKAHDNAQRLKNKAYRALLAAGAETPEEHIITWSKLQEIPAYQQTRKTVQELFQNDVTFRESCIDMVRAYLSGQQLKGDLSFENRVAIGVRYYLDEIPIFANTPGILGVESSVYCYHQLSRFHSQLYQRQLPIVPVIGQARAILIDDKEPNQHPHFESKTLTSASSQ